MVALLNRLATGLRDYLFVWLAGAFALLAAALAVALPHKAALWATGFAAGFTSLFLFWSMASFSKKLGKQHHNLKLWRILETMLCGLTAAVLGYLCIVHFSNVDTHFPAMLHGIWVVSMFQLGARLNGFRGKPYAAS